MELLIRLIVAVVVAYVVVWLLPLPSLIVGMIALLAFFLVLFGPASAGAGFNWPARRPPR